MSQPFPIPANERDRLKALDNYQIMNSLTEEEFDRITRLASIICETPISLITLLDENKQWFKSNAGFNDVKETPRELAFCQYTILDKHLFEVSDATTDLRFSANPLVTGNPDIRFYAGYPLTDPDGFALGTLCVIDKIPRHLSENQKKALELLANEVVALIVNRHQKEELLNFEKLFQLSNDLICVAGTNGFFKKVNPAFERVTGWDITTLLNTPFLNMVHQEDVTRTQQGLDQLAHGKESLELTIKVKTSTGGYKIIQWVVTKERQFDNLFAIGRDISEQARNQQEINESKAVLSAFVEHTPAAVAMLDTHMDYIAVSNRWLEDYKLKDSYAAGKSYYELFTFIPPEGKERHKRVLAGAIERREEEKAIIDAIGTFRYLKWEMRPWYHFDGSIGGMMIFTEDITDQILQRNELETAKELAESASLSKSEFLANMSHEIRTPLNGVIGFTDLLLKTNLSDTQQQYLSIVNQSANALLGIISDILDFSKIEAGKLDLDVQELDLLELSAQVTDILAFQVQNKGLELLLNLAADLPRFVMADSIRLKQVIINLLSNATKFTLQGEIELKIETLTTVGDVYTLRFTVRDTGIGIQPDKQVKIFEAFSQEDSSTTKRFGGTGLGLTISNKLLGMMGSVLQLQSTPGQGSSFFFDLALNGRAGEETEWEELDKIKEVLIVDDNENNREILTQLLKLRAIDSVSAENGYEALGILLSGKKFDAVIMDYHMPDMDGIEVIEKIRTDIYPTHSDLPIILLSSSSDSEKVIAATNKLQVMLRLIKPVRMDAIYEALSHVHKKLVFNGSGSAEILPTIATNQQLNILIAEDNEINMFLTVTILKRVATQVNIIKAKDGLVALEQCKNQMPDLIFMDIQMPEMNGYEATQAIRELPDGKRVPIIALTADNVKSELDKCLIAGMNDFLIKPIVEDTLVQVLKKWLVL